MAEMPEQPGQPEEPAQPERNIFANYDSQVRGRIVGLWQAGVHPTAICQQIGCNIKTVRLWIRHFREGGDDALADHRKRNKGVKRTTPEEDNQILDIMEERPFTTVPEVLVETQLDVSDRTVHRRLKSMGITAHRPKKKTPLTEDHRAERLEFAHAHLNWTQDQWAAVIWSDEKVFKSSDDGRRCVYRPRGSEFELDPRYVIEHQWSGRITCGFWGCMSAGGLMALHEITARMNSAEYVNILETVMLPCARARFPADEYPEIIFMHDNSAVHTSAMTAAWLEEHPEIVLMRWPRKSPDFNPIENIWSVMVKEWRSGQDRTREALRNHVFEVWDNLLQRPQLTIDLVNSMRTRMECAIASDGYWINY